MRKLWPLASILYAFVVMLLPRLQPDIAPVLHSETELIESFWKSFYRKWGRRAIVLWYPFIGALIFHMMILSA